MSKNTKIQWCDSTVNPTMGCDGCELWNPNRKTCYAGMMHVRWNGGSTGYAPTFEDVTLFPGRMTEAAKWPDLLGKDRSDKPWLNGLPRLIFVSDMSDALSEIVTFEYLKDEVISNVTSEKGQRHHWLWLTKRPNRMAEFSAWLEDRNIEWPSNLWVGTSVTTQATTSRIKHLFKVGNETTIRFLSVEPQVEQIDLDAWLSRLNWIIQGGESGHGARAFDIRWASNLIEQCEQHRVAYFLKQLGSRVTNGLGELTFNDNHAGDWSEWTEALQVREFPRRAAITTNCNG